MHTHAEEETTFQKPFFGGDSGELKTRKSVKISTPILSRPRCFVAMRERESGNNGVKK
jgi:hypothetical protein